MNQIVVKNNKSANPYLNPKWYKQIGMDINFPRLPLSIKKKWLKALRDGDYKRTSNKLCTDSRYCCLGVLAREYNMPSKVLNSDITLISFNKPGDNTIVNSNLHLTEMSEKERKALEKWLSSVPFKIETCPDPWLNVMTYHDNPTMQAICTIMNDKLGYTFDQIADFLNYHC